MGSDFFVFFFPLEVFLGFVGSPSTTTGAGEGGSSEVLRRWHGINNSWMTKNDMTKKAVNVVS